MHRRTPFILALVALGTSTGCFRARWEGTSALTRSVAQPPSTLLGAADRALRAHGWQTAIIDSTQLVTLPQPVPAPGDSMPARSAGGTGTASGGTASDRLWLLQVLLQPEVTQTVSGGTRLSIAGYLVPPTGRTAVDTLGRPSIKVTAEANPELFREVQRAGNWILEEANKGKP